LLQAVTAWVRQVSTARRAESSLAMKDAKTAAMVWFAPGGVKLDAEPLRWLRTTLLNHRDE